MKLNDIAILKADVLPFVLEENPSKLTLSFLSTVIHSSLFNQLCEDLEEICSHTKRNYSHKDLTKSVYELFNYLKHDIEGYTASFDLPDRFTWQFFILIYFNSFIDLAEGSTSDIFYAPTPADIAEVIDEKKPQSIGAIMLLNRVTKEQLHRYIDDDWEIISKEMDWLPRFPTEGSNFKDFYISDDIYVYHMSGKSIKEISEELAKEYPNNEFVFDEAWVNNKLSRYKKRIKDFNKKYPVETEF